MKNKMRLLFHIIVSNIVPSSSLAIEIYVLIKTLIMNVLINFICEMRVIVIAYMKKVK